MKNKYTFDKYFKEQILPTIVIFLIGLIIDILVVSTITYIIVKIKYGGYALIFGLIAFAIINAIYDNYKNCKEEYDQKQNTNNKNH